MLLVCVVCCNFRCACIYLQDNRVALHYAACNAHSAVVGKLLKAGADINAQGRGNADAREDLEASCQNIQQQFWSSKCCLFIQ